MISHSQLAGDNEKQQQNRWYLWPNFSWNGSTYTQSGNTPTKLWSTNGCDSIVTLISPSTDESTITPKYGKFHGMENHRRTWAENSYQRISLDVIASAHWILTIHNLHHGIHGLKPAFFIIGRRPKHRYFIPPKIRTCRMIASEWIWLHLTIPEHIRNILLCTSYD